MFVEFRFIEPSRIFSEFIWVQSYFSKLSWTFGQRKILLFFSFPFLRFFSSSYAGRRPLSSAAGPPPSPANTIPHHHRRNLVSSLPLAALHERYASVANAIPHRRRRNLVSSSPAAVQRPANPLAEHRAATARCSPLYALLAQYSGKSQESRQANQQLDRDLGTWLWETERREIRWRRKKKSKKSALPPPTKIWFSSRNYEIG